MTDTELDITALYANPRFPRASRYDGRWVANNNMGPNALWLAEWLSEVVELVPGMRVLDLGCGRAMSSIFLAREFGVTVFAADLWISASENWRRVREAGLQDRVFPIQAEAHALPFAEGFFDAIVSLDAYPYFGTDDLYLGYVTRYLRPGAALGIVVPALMRELEGGVPPKHLTEPQGDAAPFWEPECVVFHTAAWWRAHWQRTGLVEVEVADALEDGWRHWAQHEEVAAATGAEIFGSQAAALRADAGRYLGFARAVARKPAADEATPTATGPHIWEPTFMGVCSQILAGRDET